MLILVIISDSYLSDYIHERSCCVALGNISLSSTLLRRIDFGKNDLKTDLIPTLEQGRFCIGMQNYAPRHVGG